MNKVLSVIIGLLLLNLAREYCWVKPEKAENLTVDSSYKSDFNVQRKEWSYYSDILNEKNMPVNSLPLVLRGTIISNPSRSFAIIEDLSSNKQDLYALGDVISGARIVSMNRNRVVLDYNGLKQELSMFDMAEAPPRPCLVSGHVRGVASNNGVDFAEMLTQLRIKPYFEGNRCIGFQLSNINSNFIKQMGVEDGDIIESINGVKINDPLKALQMLYNLERNNPVHLGIERRDEKIELDCKLEG